MINFVSMNFTKIIYIPIFKRQIWFEWFHFARMTYTADMEHTQLLNEEFELEFKSCWS